MNIIDSLELRRAIRMKYVWPGGYALYGVCSDGGCLCCECMRENYERIAYARRHKLQNGWRVDTITSTQMDDAETICDNCNKVIN